MGAICIWIVNGENIYFDANNADDEKSSLVILKPLGQNALFSGFGRVR
jgi:hypothetical protein